MNICSAIVHAKPEVAGIVQASLEEFAGVEVHGGAEEGKLIVTLEGEGDDALADTMAKFNDVSGVINTVMIYHYCGDEPADKEVMK
ncbi:MAG: chaperone NapD [Sedimenticola sp.]|uniref:Chaperone NapD n=1 Tax=Sedimenticola thiotaurini TaxID=1543721 RepID=A0A558D1S3_9GAMM|nr:chaperone NapD [Sedimenticola sp.]MCW8947326.1 chaperone NapD [Sedimenticola sp.]MCW8975699.1 chaperone NapD [Sedimenticola sp.]TVT54974.1 MAG: ferredoxin [Sedimenticola thiotaurini]